MIEITTIAEYDYLISKGYKPLINWKWFYIDFKLRVEIQNSLFGGSVDQQNQKFYTWVWKNSIHTCKECGKPLADYSSVYISHIISRGSDRRMSIDPRNTNILCYKHHSIWETGNKTGLKIYPENKLIINILKADYNL